MKSFNELFENAQNLPSIPEVVRELILSFENASVDIKQIADKIALDQVLMAKVLRMANSPRFGLARQVASINDAIIVLGFNSVRTLVVAGGLVGAFKGPPGFDLKGFWRRSSASAGYAQWLAKGAAVREDIAFTGGLMSHLGLLLIAMEAPKEFDVIERAKLTGAARAAMEESLLGFNHGYVGAVLASRWNFPQDLVQAFKFYPNPDSSPEFLPLAGVLHLADYVTEKRMAEASEQELVAGLPATVIEHLGLAAGSLVAALPALTEVSASMEDLLG